jgi:hypothetical protein
MYRQSRIVSEITTILKVININGNEYHILEKSFLVNNSDHKMTIVSNNLLAENLQSFMELLSILVVQLSFSYQRRYIYHSQALGTM